MPMYEYKCRDCGEESEHIQKFSDAPLTECETCGGRLEKQISAAAFHLKGGGWYADGYASRKDGAAKSDASSDKGDAGSSKSDAGSSAGDSGSSSTKKTESKKGSGSSDAA